MKRSFDRIERIADLVKKTLAQIILQDASDERFRFVTVTGVQIARDLSFARVYVSVISDDSEEIKSVIDALNRAAKNIRYQLAQSVKIRIVPKLKFEYDESTARGFRISSLIDAAVKKIEE